MTTTPTSGAADLPDAMHMAELLENPINVVCQKTAAAVLRHQHSEFERLHALAAGQATAAQAVVPPNAITASVMRDDGGEAPAFCLMAAYRSEKDAMDAFALIAAADATNALRAAHGQAPAQTADSQLLQFYGVTTDAELIAAQAAHIEKLQAKLTKTPSFAPQRVREG